MSEETIKWTQERIEKAADLLEDANAKICACTTLRMGAMKDLQELAYKIQKFLGPYGNGPIDQEPVERTEMPAVPGHGTDGQGG